MPTKAYKYNKSRWTLLNISLWDELWRKDFFNKRKVKSQRTCLLFQRNTKLFFPHLFWFIIRIKKEKKAHISAVERMVLKCEAIFFLHGFVNVPFEFWRCMPTRKKSECVWWACFSLHKTQSSEFSIFLRLLMFVYFWRTYILCSSLFP